MKTLHRGPEVKERRQIRVARRHSAREAIGELVPGYEALILTYGQFSLMDLIAELVHRIGGGRVILATWTAGSADLEHAARLVEHADIHSWHMMVDRSFVERQPDYCAKMRRLFGPECIRTMRTHTKWATVRNHEWSLCIRTSMNLNENRRMEQIEVSDDEKMADFLDLIAWDLWGERDSEELRGPLPRLESLEDEVRERQVSNVGRVSL